MFNCYDKKNNNCNGSCQGLCDCIRNPMSEDYNENATNEEISKYMFESKENDLKIQEFILHYFPKVK